LTKFWGQNWFNSSQGVNFSQSGLHKCIIFEPLVIYKDKIQFSADPYGAIVSTASQTVGFDQSLEFLLYDLANFYLFFINYPASDQTELLEKSHVWINSPEFFLFGYLLARFRDNTDVIAYSCKGT